jgi:hypothetical protein
MQDHRPSRERDDSRELTDAELRRLVGGWATTIGHLRWLGRIAKITAVTVVAGLVALASGITALKEILKAWGGK